MYELDCPATPSSKLTQESPQRQSFFKGYFLGFVKACDGEWIDCLGIRRGCVDRVAQESSQFVIKVSFHNSEPSSVPIEEFESEQEAEAALFQLFIWARSGSEFPGNARNPGPGSSTASLKVR